MSPPPPPTRCRIDYESIAFWAENATHFLKFRIVLDQCNRLIGRKKPLPAQIAEFNRRFYIQWHLDDSFDICYK